MLKTRSSINIFYTGRVLSPLRFRCCGVCKIKFEMEIKIFSAQKIDESEVEGKFDPKGISKVQVTRIDFLFP